MNRERCIICFSLFVRYGGKMNKQINELLEYLLKEKRFITKQMNRAEAQQEYEKEVREEIRIEVDRE